MVSTRKYPPPGETVVGKEVRLHDATGGKELRRFTRQSRRIVLLAFTPGGKSFLSRTVGGWHGADLLPPKDRTLWLWDMATGQVRARLDGCPGGNFVVVISPDGRHALVGGAGAFVRQYRLPGLPPGGRGR